MAPIIRELSKSMINKIAAGEVVERPMNVVKELVENSIDAGATKIEVEVERSGSELIRVIDNGCGIPADQLLLAITPHATSKISDPEDLFRIHTLGFRGEAMASISEVSQFILTSRVKDADDGAQIRCDGGTRGEIQPIGRAVGTTVEVRNLFFNVPARRKFLKSQTTEFGKIQDAFIWSALPNTGIAFVLKRNGRVVYDIPASAGMRERAKIIYGAELGDRLIFVESSYRDVKIEGWVGTPDLTRSTSAFQALFLNRRFFRDRSLSHALAEAYRGLILSGRFPVAFVNITVPPDFVDVNVHPTKTELKFVDQQAIYAGLLGALRENFLRKDITSRPSVDELAAAVKRSNPREEEKAPEKTQEKAPEVAKRDVAPTSADSTETSSEEPHKLRFVPDVDPSDPTLALDPSVAESKRQEALNWFPSRKEGKKPENASEPTSNASGEKKAPTSRENAQETLNLTKPTEPEPAPAPTPKSEPVAKRPKFPELEQKEQNADALRRSAQRALTGKGDEFRKFPPLPGGASERRPDRDSNYAPGSFGGRYETSDNRRAERNESASDASSRSDETIAESTRRDADADLAEAARANLRERVAANNQGALAPNQPTSRQVARTSEGKPIVQICRRYLVMESKDGMAIVDQHALHERILYERLKANLAKGSVEAQRLLVPEVVDLAPSEFPIVIDNREIFAKLGIMVEAFGGSSVVVNSYPAVLRDVSPTDSFLEALAVVKMKRGKAEFSDLYDSALKQMACKAAVKAGDSLRPDSVVELIASAEEEIQSHHCPHGRPSTLVLSCQEIDKLFKRL